MRILIADDEQQMLKILAAFLGKEGYTVDIVDNGEDAVNKFQQQNYDLVILDWMMPKKDGLTACKEIKATSDVKVMILTAKNENEDEFAAFQGGADDYIKKPFHPGVLIARIKRLLPKQEWLQFEDIVIDEQAKRILKNGCDVSATKTEYELIKALATRRGQILTRQQLLDLVWGYDYEGDERTVDTHIRRVRDKILSDAIKTHRGIGYSLEVKG
ncbi:MAG: response regulator transcription factor [Culicoidibacterales bacterium]